MRYLVVAVLAVAGSTMASLGVELGYESRPTQPEPPVHQDEVQKLPFTPAPAQMAQATQEQAAPATPIQQEQGYQQVQVPVYQAPPVHHYHRTVVRQTRIVAPRREPLRSDPKLWSGDSTNRLVGRVPGQRVLDLDNPLTAEETAALVQRGNASTYEAAVRDAVRQADQLAAARDQGIIAGYKLGDEAVKAEINDKLKGKDVGYLIALFGLFVLVVVVIMATRRRPN